jgi:hypothetical protein
MSPMDPPVSDAAEAIEFSSRAFGAEEIGVGWPS